MQNEIRGLIHEKNANFFQLNCFWSKLLRCSRLLKIVCQYTHRNKIEINSSCISSDPSYFSESEAKQNV